MDQLTLIVCSFNTPFVLHNMLKSYVKHNSSFLPQKILLMENSTNEETVEFLQQNNVPFQRNSGDTHSISLDKALKICDTKYALIVDSDVLFNKSIQDAYEYFAKCEATLMGELIKSRGGYKLISRIAPWFCFVNMENIRKYEICFHDQKRIDESGSQGFFNNIPLQRNENGVYYDCGSSFLEDVLKANLKVLAISQETREEFCHHFEGMSWRKRSGIPGYVALGNVVEKEFAERSKELIDIDIKDKFVE